MNEFFAQLSTCQMLWFVIIAGFVFLSVIFLVLSFILDMIEQLKKRGHK